MAFSPPGSRNRRLAGSALKPSGWAKIAPSAGSPVDPIGETPAGGHSRPATQGEAPSPALKSTTITLRPVSCLSEVASAAVNTVRPTRGVALYIATMVASENSPPRLLVRRRRDSERLRYRTSEGMRLMTSSKSFFSSWRIRASLSACTVAEWVSPISSEISPKESPLCRTVSVFSSPVTGLVKTRTRPELMM